jgi:hypothetical protein
MHGRRNRFSRRRVRIHEAQGLLVRSDPDGAALTGHGRILCVSTAPALAPQGLQRDKAWVDAHAASTNDLPSSTGVQYAMADDTTARGAWLWQAEERARRPFALLHLSSHGLLLQVDVRLAFLAGAWASVIVMAQAVIEATLRDLHFQDYESKAKQLFFGQADLERLRALRNQLLHPSEPGTPSSIWVLPDGDYKGCHAELQTHARWAYELMLEAVYSGRE